MMRASALLIHSVAGQPIEAIARGEAPFERRTTRSPTGGLLAGRPSLPGDLACAQGGSSSSTSSPSSTAARSSAAPAARGQGGENNASRAPTSLPCDFQLVAAANPVPLRPSGRPGASSATCSMTQVVTYQSRIGGPLMDRIDVVVDVPRPQSSKVIRGQTGMGSAEMCGARGRCQSVQGGARGARRARKGRPYRQRQS